MCMNYLSIFVKKEINKNNKKIIYTRDKKRFRSFPEVSASIAVAST